MLTVALLGRLGNQLFQAAAGIAQAKKLGKQLLLPEQAHAGAANWDNFLHALPHGAVPALAWVNVEETEPSAGQEHVRLCGYFQNDRYFREQADEVFKLLRLPPVQEQQVLQLASTLRADCKQQWVMLHIRRGDYVQLEHALPASYYLDALRLHFADLDRYMFAVCSDDPEWCQRQAWLGALPHVHFLQTGFSDAMEMALLAHLCDHFVLANSTFSWWVATFAAAWHPEREHQVYYPKPWFLHQCHELEVSRILMIGGHTPSANTFPFGLGSGGKVHLHLGVVRKSRQQRQVFRSLFRKVRWHVGRGQTLPTEDSGRLQQIRS